MLLKALEKSWKSPGIISYQTCMNHVLANNALPLAIEIQGFCLMHSVRMLKGLTTYCSICAAVIFLMNFFLTWVHGHLSVRWLTVLCLLDFSFRRVMNKAVAPGCGAITSISRSIFC